MEDGTTNSTAELVSCGMPATDILPGDAGSVLYSPGLPKTPLRQPSSDPLLWLTKFTREVSSLDFIFPRSLQTSTVVLQRRTSLSRHPSSMTLNHPVDLLSGVVTVPVSGGHAVREDRHSSCRSLCLP